MFMLLELADQTLMLAQEGPPAPTDPSAVTGQSGAPGSGTGPAGGSGQGAPGTNFLMILFVVFVAFIVFSMWGQRRDKKKRVSMLSAIKKHDRVQTIGGIVGSVVDVKPDTIVLKVDESSNTRITFARSAVQQVLSSSKVAAAEPAVEA
jgi:preprotein translocase subunit YajC